MKGASDHTFPDRLGNVNNQDVRNLNVRMEVINRDTNNFIISEEVKNVANRVGMVLPPLQND